MRKPEVLFHNPEKLMDRQAAGKRFRQVMAQVLEPYLLTAG
jgi:hypothetical protein